MPEGMNAEVAEELGERKEPRSRGREEFVEILEALVLALVAIATAWSGYQGAEWDGRQALLYGQSSTMRVDAGVAATEGGEQRLQDTATLNTWISAKTTGDEEVAKLYVRRFSPEYIVAFYAWLKTAPLVDPNAPPGPTFMPQYHNALLERSHTLNTRASMLFADGTEARRTAAKYVRVTVLFATVLFLIALSQRFKLRNVRVATIVVAGVVLAFALVSVSTYPRI